MEIKETVHDKWIELMFDAEEKFAFGEKFDKDKFFDAIKEAFVYFFEERKGENYNKKDIELYGMLCSYGTIPDVLNKNDEEYEASKYIAKAVAEAFIHPEIFEIGENSITGRYFPDGPLDATYDFEKEDFSEFIYLVKMMNE